jgi:23S rRNA pseudouridine1911/1915/1917 synthase
MAHIHFPLLGDPLYGGRLKLPSGADERLLQVLRGFNRQALHATRLQLRHPKTTEDMYWEAPVPEDMQALILTIREENPKEM